MHGPLLLSLLPPLLLLSLLPAALGGSAKAVLHSWDLGAWTRLGSVTLEETPGTGKVRVSGVLNGLSPGQHGFHIHALGDLENGCSGAGGHFNPAGLTHGAPTAAARHAGDLGNILADAQGRALVDISDGGFSLYGPDSVVGRAVMVHAGRDDLGLGGDAESLKTGNAGARVACGVIGVASEGFVVMPEEAKLSSGPNLDPAQLNFQPPDSDCVDSETQIDPGTGTSYCPTWRAIGFCSLARYQPYMNDKCKRTCGRC